MSLSFRDLLLRLLEKDPEKRINMSDLRRHDFFKDVDWAAVEGRLNPPPLKELIEKQRDTIFRDATNEEYSRKRIVKHMPRDNF
jgi:serine/threonine protein kinase